MFVRATSLSDSVIETTDVSVAFIHLLDASGGPRERWLGFDMLLKCMFGASTKKKEKTRNFGDQGAKETHERWY